MTSRLLLAVWIALCAACASHPTDHRGQFRERVVVMYGPGVDAYARLFVPLSPYLFDPWHQPGYVWGISYYPRPVWTFVGARRFDPFWGWYWPYDVRFGPVWPYHVYGYGYWPSWGPVWYGPGWSTGRPIHLLRQPTLGPNSSSAAQRLADDLNRSRAGQTALPVGFAGRTEVEYGLLPAEEPWHRSEGGVPRGEWPEGRVGRQPEWLGGKPAVTPPNPRGVVREGEIQPVHQVPNGFVHGTPTTIERIDLPQPNFEPPRWQGRPDRSRSVGASPAPAWPERRIEPPARSLSTPRSAPAERFDSGRWSTPRHEAPRTHEGREIDPR